MVIIGILFSAVLLFTFVLGVAVVFVYFPRWLFNRYSPSPTAKVAGKFALVGFLIPVLFAIKYALTRTEILSLSIFVWPTSLSMMALDSYAKTWEVVVGFLLAGLSNVGVYAFVGILFSRLLRKFGGASRV
jgi:hypothetical protein